MYINPYTTLHEQTSTLAPPGMPSILKNKTKTNKNKNIRLVHSQCSKAPTAKQRTKVLHKVEQTV